ncbi:MAG: glycoside hydrolase family 2 TIM barrel-domain containing protein [Promethearchaeota archaeon]
MSENIPKTELLREGWKFVKGNFPVSSLKRLEQLQDDIGWRDVLVPHDWDIEGPFLESNKSGSAGGYAPCGVGWYKRDLNVPESRAGKKIFLRFGGIYMRSTLWLNGKKIGNHLYGYGPFEMDISSFARAGATNQLLIRVKNNKQPSCRWYSGSGIFRPAWLIFKDLVYFPWGGIFVTSDIRTDGSAEIKIQVEIRNDSSSEANILLSFSLKDSKGEVLGSIESRVVIPAAQLLKDNQAIVLNEYQAWSIETPNLYSLDLKLIKDEKVIDIEKVKFGIRHFKFNGKGFFLNGKNIKLKGVCLHHDGGCVGAAVPPGIWRRRFKKLKSMGCNAIRTSHNVPSSDFLDLCDEMGFIVIDEAFDKWMIRPKKGSWGGLAYFRTWKKELWNFIRRDRNHPSVILWSLGNEISMIETPLMKKYHLKMRDFVRSLDPTRPITTVLSPGGTRAELRRVEKNKPPFICDMVDVFCTNYSESLVSKFHLRWPDKAIIIAEAHHYYRNKLPEETHLPTSQLHPNCTTRNPWYDVEENDYVCGQFLWTGIEYLGEVRDPYPYHGRTNAPIRISGFLKPQAGFHSSVWLEEPFVHVSVLDENADIPRGKPLFDFPKIVCHWNFKRDFEEELEVWTFNNCESVELLLNGKSLGEKLSKDYPYNTMRWKVRYKPGELIAIGKTGGVETCRSALRTAGEPVEIKLKPDKQELRSDGIDCVNVEVELIDEKGIMVQDDDRALTFNVSGCGRLIGIDNGDLSDFTAANAYQGTQCKTYWGQALLVVQSRNEPGLIDIKVESPGIKSGKISINVK